MSDQYTVQDLMSTPAVTIPAGVRLLDAALLLRRSAIRHLIVVDGGKLVGVLTDRDMQRCAPSRLMAVTEEEYNSVFESTTVERVMTRGPRSISPHATLVEAISLLQEMRHGCLPVVEDGEVVGVLTRWDLIEGFRQMLMGRLVTRAVVSRQ